MRLLWVPQTKHQFGRDLDDLRTWCWGTQWGAPIRIWSKVIFSESSKIAAFLMIDDPPFQQLSPWPRARGSFRLPIRVET